MAICEADAPMRTAKTLELEIEKPGAHVMAPGSRERADIMGIMVDRSTDAWVMEEIERFIISRTPHQVVTINVDFLNIAEKDPGFVELLNSAAIAVPDGMPLIWISRLLGSPLPQRITGTDLLLNSAKLAAERGYRIFLLGAAEGVAAEAAVLLQERFPGLNIAGTYAPPYSAGFDPAEDERMVREVIAARPDMLFVALGTPKQEKWIYTHLARLGVPVCIGVGGVFNFITGRVPRAPTWMQRAGLEWLFRLICEPRRLWRRYLLEDTRALYRAMMYTTLRRNNRASRAADSSYDTGKTQPVQTVPLHPE